MAAATSAAVADVDVDVAEAVEEPMAETWELKRGHVWMKRWLETHHLRKDARQAL